MAETTSPAVERAESAPSFSPLYQQIKSLLVTGLADVAATLVVFFFSWRHDNSSVYDPYWSVAPLPILGAWLLAAEPGASAPRAGLATALVFAWGLRRRSTSCGC